MNLEQAHTALQNNDTQSAMMYLDFTQRNGGWRWWYTSQKNGLDNHKETSDLTEAVKQTFYEEYLQAYSESNR